MIDVIGIGALNVDVALGKTSPDAETPYAFQLGGEKPIGRKELCEVFARYRVGGASLGGSSFNVVRAIAEAAPPLRLGFIGALGSIDDTALGLRQSYEDWFRTNDVDTAFLLHVEDQESGIALSLMDRGERSLLTYAGANSRLAGFLSLRHDKIVEYISSARLVHVTSFFDPVCPQMLLDILRAARERKPDLLISFDPGHHWIRDPSEAIHELYAVTDVLFVNDQEFRMLGGPAAIEPDDRIANRIMASRLVRKGAELVLKRPDYVAVYQRKSNQVVGSRFANRVLEEEQIIDATGAGDVFAAGYLIAKMLSRDDLSVALGLRFSHNLLTSNSPKDFHSYRKLLTDLLLATDLPDHPIPVCGS